MTAPATRTQAYQIQPAALDLQVTEWRTLRDKLELNLDRAQRDYSASTSFWTGAAGDRARDTAGATVTEGRKIITALDSAVTAATTGRTSITDAKNAATAAIDLVLRQKFTVAEDGTVTAPDAKLSLPADAKSDDIVAAQAALDSTAMNIYEPAVKGALATLGRSIEDTTVAIENAFGQVGDIKALAQSAAVRLGERSQRVQDILDGTATLPTDSREFHDFWTALSDEDKDALWNNNHYLGNTDGMPAIDRDHYNRLTLQEQLTEAQNTRNEAIRIAGDKHEQWLKYTNTSAEAESWLKTQPGYTEWKAKMDESRHLDDLTTTAKIADSTSPSGEPRMLLGMDDASGQRVHTIIADGDPDKASHVTTYVPGTGSQPSKMEGDVERVDSMSGAAAKFGAQNPVTIAWLGYDAPPEVVNDATQSDYARAGAPALNAFQDGLRATHEGDIPSKNTVLGHSYGTTVVGLSAAEGQPLEADNVVMVASPGAGVDHARELTLAGVPDGEQYKHIFSTRAENDPTPGYSNIPDILPGVDRHGSDPTSADFGAQVFTSDPGTSGPWWSAGYSGDAHSEYWKSGATSLNNMGAIIAGRPDRVIYQ